MRRAYVTQFMRSKTERMLKVDEAGRVWTPRELREAVLDEFERSGLPGTQFAQRIGVKYPTFASWVQKRRRERDERGSLPWVEVEVDAPDGAKAAARAALSVHLSGGARIEVADAAQVLLAAELLRALAQREGKAGALC